VESEWKGEVDFSSTRRAFALGRRDGRGRAAVIPTPTSDDARRGGEIDRRAARGIPVKGTPPDE